MKEFTTNTEDLRLETEELIKSGPNVHPLQIWRDASLIPNLIPGETVVTYDTVEEDDITYKVATVHSVRINGEIQDIIKHYKELPLKRLSGTENCYSNGEHLKDLIGPHFGKGYLFKLYINGVTVPYGLGLPEFDIEMGILKFKDDKYAEAIKDKTVTISFYKYVGRKGMTNVESLPFSDDLKHFKNANNPNQTASFLVRGTDHQDYILPSGKKAYNRGDTENTNVLVTQETISNVLYTYGTIDGGTW